MNSILPLGLAAASAFSTFMTAQDPEAPVLDPDLGVNLNLGDDHTVVVNLPFTYAYPGTGGTSQISVCSNGFVFLAADTSAPYVPSAAALQAGTARIAPMWLDLNPSLRPVPETGVYFRAQSLPANRAVITWHKVPIYGTSRLVTVQLQLLADGSYTVHYDHGVFPDRAVVVGSTPGGGAPLQAADLSRTERRPIAVTSGVTLHEEFASGLAFDLNGRDLILSPAPGGARLATRRQADSVTVADHTSAPAIEGPGWYDDSRHTVVFDGWEFDGMWYRPISTIRQAFNADTTVIGAAQSDDSFGVGYGLFATWSTTTQTLEFWQRYRNRWQPLGAMIPGVGRDVTMAMDFARLPVLVVSRGQSAPVEFYDYFDSPAPRWVFFRENVAPPGGIARSMAHVGYPGNAGLVMLVQTTSGVQHWEYYASQSPDAWRRLSIATPPAAMPMAHDFARDRIVCSNGATTWEFDRTSWRQIQVASPPAARTGHTIVYDWSRQHLWMIGGYVGGSTTASNEVWSWHGTYWSPRAFQSAGYTARTDAAMAFHPYLGAVLVGGFGTGGTALSDTLNWTGYGWTNQTLLWGSPGARGASAMAYLGALNAVVLFGGIDAGGRALGDTRALVQGSTWQAHVTGTAPSPRANHTMVHDTARDRILLFGGHDLSTPLNDTWELSAPGRQLQWSPLGASNPPPARDIHAMAYDAARRRVVLFGGRGLGNTFLADTWEYDPQTTAWRRVLPPAEGPVGRWNATMVYDVARQRCVLMGGYNGSTMLGDVWEWDGTRWLARSPGILAANPAENMAGCWQTYDRRILLAGGNRFGAPNVQSTLEVFAEDDNATFRLASWPLHLLRVPSGAGFATELMGRTDASSPSVVFLGIGAQPGFLSVNPPLVCEPSFLDLNPLITLGFDRWFSLPFPATNVLRDLNLSVQAFVTDGTCLRATETRILTPRP